MISTDKENFTEEFKDEQKKTALSTGRKVFKGIALFFKVLLSIIFILISCFLIFLFNKVYPTLSTYQQEAEQLVAESNKATFNKEETSYIYDSKGSVLCKLKSDKDSIYLSYPEIPKNVVNAFVAVEDRNFWDHHGIDLKGLVRVAYNYVKSDGSEAHGASTITQQLARNVFLSQDVTIERKLREMFVSFALENKYSKEQIMEYYVNNIYYANNYYGIGAAAYGYFNKNVSDLSLSEIAFLCSIPNSPSYYDPVKNLNNTLERRDKILGDMKDLGFIDDKQYNDAIAEVIVLNRPESTDYNHLVTFAIDCAVRYLMKANGFQFRYQFNSTSDYNFYKEAYNTSYDSMKHELLTGGYRIRTSLDQNKQSILQENINNALSFSSNVDDSGLFMLQGAATCIDNSTGKVVAIVGGRTQDELETGKGLNRAFQSHRQPGSTIKPIIVYTPSLERDYNANTIVDDSPFEGGPKESGSYLGKITLRKAVEQSKNVIAWKLFEELTPTVGLSYAQKMHFSKIMPDDEVLPVSLGGMTYGVSTLEMASAYATLANSGVYREPTCIVSILDSDRQEIYRDSTETRIYEKYAAQEMTDILTGVLDSGTARTLGWSQKTDIPAAGKTGTTSDSNDGWFCGYTPYYSMAVWVGYDYPQSVSGLWGSTYPASIWANSMLSYIEGLPTTTFNLQDWEAMSRTLKVQSSNLDENDASWLDGRPDDELLSEGYTVGDWRNDHEIAAQIDVLIKEIESVPAGDNATANGLYEQSKSLVERIYGTSLEAEYTEKINQALGNFQSKQ